MYCNFFINRSFLGILLISILMTTTTIPKNYAILFSAGQTVSDDHEYDSEY
ncbi:MAG: hypothetical protein GW805_00170 [Ignavibacteria bacterium]|nr:hypothetical protein [Ignavibacteria bacterium]